MHSFGDSSYLLKFTRISLADSYLVQYILVHDGSHIFNMVFQ